jgi:chemotaxis protein MotA
VQLIGLALLAMIVSYAFVERQDTTISGFDTYAFVMVMGGTLAAILVSSSATTTFRTFACIREVIPGLGTLNKQTNEIEAERAELTALWREGKRARAVELAEQSRYPAIRRMLDLVLDRAPEEAIESAFTEVRHETMLRWQPAISNWELASRLAPSFGMIGTIAGMIRLFQNLDTDDFNMGSAISLALRSTLYGVAFGAGVAGPVGHYLRQLLDERLGAIERCEKSVGELIARGSAGVGAA